MGITPEPALSSLFLPVPAGKTILLLEISGVKSHAVPPPWKCSVTCRWGSVSPVSPSLACHNIPGPSKGGSLSGLSYPTALLYLHPVIIQCPCLRLGFSFQASSYSAVFPTPASSSPHHPRPLHLRATKANLNPDLRELHVGR